jgi:hypothetical protein
MPDSVGRNLKTILDESYEPAYQNHFPEECIFKLEMAIPCGGHEDIRNCKKKDCFQYETVKQDL